MCKECDSKGKGYQGTTIKEELKESNVQKNKKNPATHLRLKRGRKQITDFFKGFLDLLLKFNKRNVISEGLYRNHKMLLRI